MKENGPPTEPTGFAKLLGCNVLGKFYPETREYIVEVGPLHPQATNFFRTLHGGAILGLCDDFCGMLIYYVYGVNSAVTIDVKSNIQYLVPVRTTSKLLFTCRITAEMPGIIYIMVTVTAKDKPIAHMTATWYKR